MKATISATVTRLGGIAEQRSPSGQLISASSFDDLDLDLGSPTIDLDHDGNQVGEIVYAELDDRAFYEREPEDGIPADPPTFSWGSLLGVRLATRLPQPSGPPTHFEPCLLRRSVN